MDGFLHTLVAWPGKALGMKRGPEAAWLIALEEYSADIPLRWVVVPTIGGVKMDVPRGRKKQQSLENFDRLGTEIYAALKAAGVGAGALAGVSWGASLVSVLTDSCDWQRDALGGIDALHPSAAGLEKYIRQVLDGTRGSGCMTLLLADGWNLIEAPPRARSV